MAQRPRLLWVPHGAWHALGGQRQHHLARRLADRFDIHVISWHQPRTVSGLGRARTYIWEAAPVTVHEVALAPNVYRAATRGYPPQWALAFNQRLFRRHIAAVAAGGVDAAIYSSSHHFTGYPPLAAAFPWVFDYVDLSPPDVERTYCAAAAAVLAASPALEAGARAHGRPVTLVPNGVDTQAYRRADGRALRAALGLGGGALVSLIGLTCSPRLYFVDALARMARARPVALLAVGEGPLRSAIARRAAELGVPCRTPGWVDPARVPEYFAASDVGLYPGEDTPYFRSAAPLKVLEYLAAGRPVVSSRVEAWSGLGVSGVTTALATAEGFAQALSAVLAGEGAAPGGLDGLDWDQLAGRVADVLDGVRTHRARTAAPAAAGEEG
jgi:glycosyltransferase involved in cell wall biosynthesis